MLLIGQVPLLFDLEYFRVVIVDSAGTASLYSSLSNPVSEHGSRSVPGVEPCRSTVIDERTFENRTGRQGEHIKER